MKDKWRREGSVALYISHQLETIELHLGIDDKLRLMIALTDEG